MKTRRRLLLLFVALAILAPVGMPSSAPAARAAEPSRVPPAAKGLHPRAGAVYGPRLREATTADIAKAKLRPGKGRCKGLYEDPQAMAAWEALPAGERRNPPCVASPDVVEEPTAASGPMISDASDDIVPPPVPCYTSGPSVKVFYVYRSGSTNRLVTWRPRIVRAVASADAVFDRAAKAVGGATRHVRWLMDADCELSITAVAVPSAHVSEQSPFPILSDLVAGGRLASNQKALVFTDDGGSTCSGLGGIASTANDDSPGPTNAANSGRSIARVFGYCTSDPDMRLGDLGSIAAHELMHTLGAVQASAPHATPNGHCTDEDDLMCYPDGGGPMQAVCPAEWWQPAFDCNKDDYFNPSPPAGTYLAAHWNTSDNVYLARSNATAVSAKAPQVAITSPAPGAAVGGDVAIDVSAAASAGASIARVDIYVNGTLRGSPTAAPYAVTVPTAQGDDGVSPLPNGALTIDAIAWDGAGRWAFAPTVTVSLENPRVRLLEPADGSLSGGSVAWSAEPVVGAGRTVTKVELLDDSGVVATDVTAPYGGTWTPEAGSWGTVSLAARVTDSAGGAAISPRRNIVVPRIHVVARAPSSATAGVPLRLGARVTPWPEFSGVDRVDFYVTRPGASTPSLAGTATGPSYATWWTPPADRLYVIVARAIGTVALASDSWPLYVQVSTPPAGFSLALVSPAEGATVTGTSTMLAASLALPAGWSVADAWFEVDGDTVSPVTLVGTSLQAAWDLSGVAAGSHLVSAVVSAVNDVTGDWATIATPGALAWRPGPAIAITSPAAGTVVSGDLVVTAILGAQPGDPVTSVEVCVGAAHCLWTDGSRSTTSLDFGAGALPADGPARIWAIAFTAHSRAVSDPVDVTVAQQRVALTSPASGARVGGRTILAAEAVGEGGVRVERIVFLLDGEPVGSADPSWSSTFEAEWNTGLATAGAHMLSARAQLGDGRTIETAGTPVTVVQPGMLVNPIAKITRLAPVRLTRSVTMHWSATPAGAPIVSYDVRYRRAPWNRGFGAYVAWRTATTTTSATLSLATGYTYCFSARAHDVLPSVSPWTAESCTTIPLDDRSLARSGSWTSGTGSSYYLGTYRRSYTYGAKLTRTGVRARSISIVATTCPTCGTVRLYLGSSRLGTIRLVSGTTRNRQVIPIAWFCTARTGTLTIKVVSSGKKVVIDGVAIGGG